MSEAGGAGGEAQSIEAGPVESPALPRRVFRSGTLGKLVRDPGSSVRVNARTTLGSIPVDGRLEQGSWIIGDGQATLDVEASLGSVRVLTV